MAFWQSAGPDPVADLCRPGRRGLRLGDDAAPAAAGAADALPFLGAASGDVQPAGERGRSRAGLGRHAPSHALALAAHEDRKSTRLNSSHLVISYAVFCLKKK